MKPFSFLFACAAIPLLCAVILQSTADAQTPASATPPSRFSNGQQAERLLRATAAKMAATNSLTVEYEERRRFLDPPEEIRETGSIRLLKTNFLRIESRLILLPRAGGEPEQQRASTGYASDGKMFYTLLPQSDGIAYQKLKARPDGSNLVLNVAPVADFFDGNKSYSHLMEMARHRGALKELGIVGGAWENKPCQIVAMVVEDTLDGVPRRTVAILTIGADKRIYRVISRVQTGEISTESDTVLHGLDTNKTLKKTDFLYRLPVKARLSVPPPALLTNGGPAPEFALKDKNGNPINLSDFKGKTVILDFWATWCVPCIKSFPHTAETAEKFGNNVVVLAVNMYDDPEQCMKWISAHPEYNNFIFAADAPGKGEKSTAIRYHITDIPVQYILSPHGRITASISGYFGPAKALEKAIRSSQEKP